MDNINLIDWFGTDKEILTSSGIIPTINIFSLCGKTGEFRKVLKHCSGIYCWYCRDKKKIYIGSSNDLWRRFNEYALNFSNKDSKRGNVIMNNHVYFYGHNSLKFYILEFFNGEINDLRKREQMYLDMYKPFRENGFNIATNVLDYYKSVLSLDGKRRIVEAIRGENNSLCKLKDEDIIQIKEFLCEGVTLRLIAKKFNVSITVISNIKRGKTWKHIKASKKMENKIDKLIFKNKHKFSIETILKIKKDFKNGLRSIDISKKYNLIYSTVHSIKKGHIYKNVNPP